MSKGWGSGSLRFIQAIGARGRGLGVACAAVEASGSGVPVVCIGCESVENAPIGGSGGLEEGERGILGCQTRFSNIKKQELGEVVGGVLMS